MDAQLLSVEIFLPFEEFLSLWAPNEVHRNGGSEHRPAYERFCRAFRVVHRPDLEVCEVRPSSPYIEAMMTMAAVNRRISPASLATPRSALLAGPGPAPPMGPPLAPRTGPSPRSRRRDYHGAREPASNRGRSSRGGFFEGSQPSSNRGLSSRGGFSRGSQPSSRASSRASSPQREERTSCFTQPLRLVSELSRVDSPVIAGARRVDYGAEPLRAPSTHGGHAQRGLQRDARGNLDNPRPPASKRCRVPPSYGGSEASRAWSDGNPVQPSPNFLSAAQQAPSAAPVAKREPQDDTFEDEPSALEDTGNPQPRQGRLQDGDGGSPKLKLEYGAESPMPKLENDDE